MVFAVCFYFPLCPTLSRKLFLGLYPIKDIFAFAGCFWPSSTCQALSSITSLNCSNSSQISTVAVITIGCQCSRANGDAPADGSSPAPPVHMRYIDRLRGRADTKTRKKAEPTDEQKDNATVQLAVKPITTKPPQPTKSPSPKHVQVHSSIVPRVEGRSNSVDISPKPLMNNIIGRKVSAGVKATEIKSRIQLDANMGDQRRFEVTYEDQSYIVDLSTNQSRPYTFYKRQDSISHSYVRSSPSTSVTHLANSCAMSSAASIVAGQRAKGSHQNLLKKNCSIESGDKANENEPSTSTDNIDEVDQTEAAINAIKKWVFVFIQ
ncbi:hypothetical protein DdX_02766 [Ditylenchus destructor]|uniref:Uncharacterized protein n=1 Tax=Ditylenchus destructor TaxID=166010 RepID=A0AAD4NET4_9BILA|nr:hypothetical protein DdX_02766 [Ditylenchus destructor]